MLLFVQLLLFCLKFAFVVFRSFLADISHLCTCKDRGSAVLCKSEVIRVKFVEIRPFSNKAVISSGSKNSGFENSFKNCLFYLQRIHDVIALISRQQYMQIKFESMQARQVVSSRLRRSFVRLRRSKRWLGARLLRHLLHVSRMSEVLMVIFSINETVFCFSLFEGTITRQWRRFVNTSKK